MDAGERKRRGINRAGEPRHTASAAERQHGNPRRQEQAMIREESAIRFDCGHTHTPKGFADARRHGSCVGVRPVQ